MTCSICAETITDRAMKAGDKLYHEEHFTCTQCGLSLAGADVATYTKQESLYCQDCYMALFVPVCARCNQYITQVKEGQEEEDEEQGGVLNPNIFILKLRTLRIGAS